MKHPAEAELALFAGRDLGFWRMLLLRRHVSVCRECSGQVVRFRSARESARELGAGMPVEAHWDRLSEEMTGNIRVGLAAGQAIARFSFLGAGPRRLGWRAGFALAGATAIFGTAFWTSLPQPQADHLVSAMERIRWERLGVAPFSRAPAMQNDSVEASGMSIEVRANGGTLSLLHPRSNDVSITVNMQGSAGARYIDADTGQVTINKVYYAQ